MKKRSQISNEKEKLLNEKNKKGVGDISENVFCLVVSLTIFFGRLSMAWSFLVEAACIKEFLSHINIIPN